MILNKVWNFYRDGFREMDVGRKLWLIIVIKLFIMFAILKVFFFQGALSHLDTVDAKGEHIRQQLIDRGKLK
ncbi:MAG: DUF4492 domain-containing protein [Marinifilaceae bacterium]